MASLLKFYTGDQLQLAQLTYGQSQYIALNTATGQMYWNHGGTKYYMNYRSDWDISDSSLPSFIKNKPDVPTIQDLMQQLDISQLPDSMGLVTPHKQPIVPSQVTSPDGKHFYLKLGKRRPQELIGSSSMFSVQTDSLSMDSSDAYTIQLSRYMAYQNTPTLPSGWVLIYS